MIKFNYILSKLSHRDQRRTKQSNGLAFKKDAAICKDFIPYCRRIALNFDSIANQGQR